METVLNQFTQLTNLLTPRLGVEELNSLLGYSFIDNLNRKKTTDNWQSNYNGQTLKNLITLSEIQQSLLAPFGWPKEASTGWLTPLIESTKKSVAAGDDPDLVAMDNIRIESAYARQIKLIVDQVTHNGEFDREACEILLKNPAGQAWLTTQLKYCQQLEWQYHSSGQTRLRAIKKLLRSLLQVIANEPLADLKKNPYRKLDANGERLQSDEEYLKDCEIRLLALQKEDAFDVRRFALESPHAVIGASKYEEIEGSELYSARLRYYPRPEGVKSNGRSLYLATPMINRSELFDLAPGKSVIEGMLAQGYDIYMVDYGNPGPDQSELGLEFYGQTVHDKYLAIIEERHPKQEIVVMAYCMGGTLFLPYLARRIEELQIEKKALNIHKLVLLTTPVYFDDETSGHKPMRDVIRNDYSNNIMKTFYGQSNVPPQTIELGMHTIQPGVAFSVAEGFYARANFPGALADAAPFLHWLNSGTRFPAKAHRQWIQKVFIDNEIWEGKFTLPSKFHELDGKPVNMDKLTEAKVAIFDYRGLRDPIAPVGSCLASERWGNGVNCRELTSSGLNRTIEKNIGHIFVVSKKLLAEFLEAANDFLNYEEPKAKAADKEVPKEVAKTEAKEISKEAVKETPVAKAATKEASSQTEQEKLQPSLELTQPAAPSQPKKEEAVTASAKAEATATTKKAEKPATAKATKKAPAAKKGKK